MGEQNCDAGTEALIIVKETVVQLRALERKVDRGDADRIRLGDRVTMSEESIAQHEAMTSQSVKKLHDTIGSLDQSVMHLQQSVEAAIGAPPVPTGIAVLESWKQTPVSARAKIGAAIVGVLASSEVLKSLLEALINFLRHAVK